MCIQIHYDHQITDKLSKEHLIPQMPWKETMTFSFESEIQPSSWLEKLFISLPKLYKITPPSSLISCTDKTLSKDGIL